MIALLLAVAACGVQDWPRKILTDPGATAALALPPLTRTVAQLGALRTARRRRYIVEGQVLEAKIEDDGDLHIVLTEGGRTMVIELPDPQCALGSKALPALRRARLQAAGLRVGQRVRVVGVLFFDHLHGQSGAAPNGAELHPVLSIRRLK